MKRSVNAMIASAMAAAALISGGAHSADPFPSRPVRIVVGFTPGTTSDVFARMIAQKLAEKWGQPVLVENRDGAAGAIAAEAVSRAAPDGHTLMLGSNSITLGPILRAQLPYDPFRDFVPITQVAQTPNIFLIGKGLGVNNLKEFIAYSKTPTARLQYASSGRGTPSHLTVELFKALADVKMEEIPYKSSGQALTDTISGQVALNAPGIAQGLPHVTGGKVVALGVTGSKRAPKAPDVPTLAEAGVPGYEAYGWHGIFAPAKLPPEVLAVLSRDITEVLAPSDMRERFSQQGAEVVASSSPQFGQFLRSDFEKWKTLFQKLGIKPE